MRRGVHVRNSVKHAVYHLNCVDSDNPVYKSCGFAKGLLTVEAKDRGEFVRMITEAPQLFFCAGCDHFMFDSVEYYNDAQFAIPSTEVWPACNVMHSYAELGNHSYAILHVQKLIALVYANRRKKRKSHNKENEVPTA